MIIAVAANGKSLNSPLDEQFGRCKYFVFVDSETMAYDAIANPGEEMQSGAGPKAAEIIISRGAQAVLAGRVGEKAEVVLKKGGITIVVGYKSTMSVNDALKNFLSK
jgi:predicted Fe-Mo cluster-binding NifX family protein